MYFINLLIDGEPCEVELSLNDIYSKCIKCGTIYRQFFSTEELQHYRPPTESDFIFKAIPHNSTRADPEKIWVLIQALFRRCTLCISSFSGKVRQKIRRQDVRGDLFGVSFRATPYNPPSASPEKFEL